MIYNTLRLLAMHQIKYVCKWTMIFIVSIFNSLLKNDILRSTYYLLPTVLIFGKKTEEKQQIFKKNDDWPIELI
jgi:hypothetical protein